MQFLGFAPGAAVAVFTKVFHHQTHILKMTDARFRMPEPKALRMTAHQRRRALAQLRRRGRGRRHFAQFIVLGSHADKLRTARGQGKKSLAAMPQSGTAPRPPVAHIREDLRPFTSALVASLQYGAADPLLRLGINQPSLPSEALARA